MTSRHHDDQTRTHNHDDTIRAHEASEARRTERAIGSHPWLLGGVVFLVGILAGGLLWSRWRVIPATEPVAGTTTPLSELDAAVAEADRLDPGWRWEQLCANRSVVSDNENGAPVVIEAGKLLPADGRGLPAFVDRAAETGLDELQLAELDTWLAPRADAARIALTLKDRPRGRYDIKMAPDLISTHLPHLNVHPRIIDVLRGEAARRAEAGTPGQLDEFQALVNCSRSIGDEPIVVSQLSRSAALKLGIHSLERTLARANPGEEALARAQKSLSDEIEYNGLLIAWRGERAIIFDLLEAIENGKVSPEPLLAFLRALGKQVNWPAEATPGNPGLRAIRAWYLRHQSALVEVARLPPWDQPAALNKVHRKSQTAPPGTTFFESLLHLGQQDAEVQRIFQQHSAQLRSAIVALAAEQFRLRIGHWPLDPKELNASFGVSIATDPFDGSPLRFRRLDDGLIVYSIGSNGRDDGGDIGDRGNTGPDVGFRLRDPQRRR